MAEEHKIEIGNYEYSGDFVFLKCLNKDGSIILHKRPNFCPLCGKDLKVLPTGCDHVDVV